MFRARDPKWKELEDTTTLGCLERMGEVDSVHNPN
jgi:hypothetical protein